MARIHQIIFLVGWSILLLFASGCASLEDPPNYSKKGLSVTFPRLSDIAAANEEEVGELDDFEIDHPIRLSEDLVRNQLLSLWYRNVDPRGKARPVFTAKEAEQLSPLFRAALNKVNGSEYIRFEYESRGGMIEGEVFGTIGKIHWRINRIQDVYFSDDLLSSRDTWNLVRRIRSQYLRKEKTAVLTLTRKNWIINDRNLPYTKRKPGAEVVPPSPVRKKPTQSRPSKQLEDPELKRKLMSLKQLKDEGLINEEEYRRKKEELLNQYLNH